MGSSLLQCYNRTCGQKYCPDENHQDACTYHPGAPFFHDAYKGWSCCKKKTVDFTEFLNVKGCTKGFHSNVKPEEPVKISGDKTNVNIREYREPISSKCHTTSASVTARPSFDLPTTQLENVVSASLSRALHQQQKERESEQCGESKLKSGSTEPPEGTSCVHSGCTERKGTLQCECRYHSGGPVFHEGMKYWSCCQRKTSDFNAFLGQEGCTVGTHQWIKSQDRDQDRGESRSNVRFDWHQTGSHVFVAIYARMSDPQLTAVHVGPVRLRVHVVFDGGAVFDQDLELCQPVDVGQSSVQLLASKVEVKLKKAGAASWKQLHVPREPASDRPQPTDSITDDTKRDDVVSVSSRVDAVDLSDL